MPSFLLWKGASDEHEWADWEIRTLRELQALIEDAQAEAEDIKDAIKAHMGASEELRALDWRGIYKEDATNGHVTEKMK